MRKEIEENNNIENKEAEKKKNYQTSNVIERRLKKNIEILIEITSLRKSNSNSNNIDT